MTTKKKTLTQARARIGRDLQKAIAKAGAARDAAPDGPGYSDKLEADFQISTEEAIASTIFEYTEECLRTLDEEDCQRLGRSLLKLVLGRFRPDLFDTGK